MRLLLLEAASRLVEELGRGAVSLRLLASNLSAAGTPVTHTALLAHFESLDALLEEVAAAWWDDCADAIDRARQEQPEVPRQLLAMSAAYIAYAIDHEHRFRLMYDSNLWKRAARSGDGQAGESRLAEGRNRAFAAFVDVVTNGRADGSLSPHLPAMGVARLVTSLSHGLAMEFIDERLGAADTQSNAGRRRRLAHAAELLRLAMQGIGGPMKPATAPAHTPTRHGSAS